MASLDKEDSEEQPKMPELHSKEMNCMFCGEKMFYSEENFVHVCLRGDHGILAYFEPDSCWFAAEEATVAKLKEKGVKHHYIPKHVFENGGIGENFECDYKAPDSS
jgi:hypothetical protein